MTWTLPPSTLLQEPTFAEAPLVPELGMTPDGKQIRFDLSAAPHIVVAGASGAGKTQLIHGILTSLLMVDTPDDLRLILVDVTDELDDYRGIPHMSQDPIDDPAAAVAVLEGLGQKMGRRYELFRRKGVRNIAEYNESVAKLPRILCVVDEFAALMLNRDYRVRTERAVATLGIRGRKAGIHLLLSTQIPHATVLTPTIKANLTARICLRVPSKVFSRVALDEPGAEQLRNPGDGLLRDGLSLDLRPFRSTFVPRETVQAVAGFWRAQAPASSRVSREVRRANPVSTPTRVPRAPEESRRRVGRPVLAPSGWTLGRKTLLLMCLALIFIGVDVVIAGTGNGCPSGTQFSPDTISELCVRPDHTVRCVISTTGYTPKPGGDAQGDVYVKRTALGPWCH